jgi:histidinol-phosphate aminotransferase
MPAVRPHLAHLSRVDSADIRGDFVRLDRNERVSPLPDAVFDGIVATMDRRTFSSYPDPKPLVDAFASMHNVDSRCVAATNGSDAAIRRAFQAFVAPHDRVVMSSPTYAMYAVYASIAEADAVQLEYAADRRPEPNRWLTMLERGVRMLCLVNPDNPTGAVLQRDEILRVVGAAAERDVLCLVDETYYPCHPETVIDAVRDHANLIVIRSLSKAYGLGGLRVGFACGAPPLIEALNKVRGLHELNGVAVHAARYLLTRPGIVKEMIAELEAGRAVLALWARARGFGLPVCPTNFQLVELPHRLDPADLVARLRVRGFLVKGGFTAVSLRRCLRVTLDGPPLMHRFVEACDESLADRVAV